MRALNVLITSCTRPEAYDLLSLIGRGKVFGERQPVSITLYDEHSQNSKLKILASEIKDCASIVLQDIYVQDGPERLFREIDFAIMLDTIETVNSLLGRLKLCKQVYARYGKYLEEGAKQSINIIIAGDPIYINAYFMSRYAPSFSKSSFTGCLRMEHDRATSMVAKKLDVSVDSVKNTVIWGNSMSNFLVDISHAEFQAESRLYKSPIEQINNDHWRKYILQPYVKNKCSEVSPASEIGICKARAIASHIKDLWFGTSTNWTSMIVHSSGEYGVPKNIFFGFPVSIRKPQNQPEIFQNLKFHEWEEAQFVQNIHKIDEHSKILQKICEGKELEEEPCLVSTEHKKWLNFGK
ncbi:unnamed protein product [Rodentolepis nana]|uniref:Ldh_1_C domain-containing protein n=1 Tax=Rodentolepis nana TaxID=102285 RepID=A0A0R3TVR3_RODNA|nr:unnamed protein product [Rodentolepis nana]